MKRIESQDYVGEVIDEQKKREVTQAVKLIERSLIY